MAVQVASIGAVASGIRPPDAGTPAPSTHPVPMVEGALAPVPSVDVRLNPTPIHPSSGGGVNLSHGYTHEPAPIGVADYGLDDGGAVRAVATPVLLGVASLGTSITWNGSLVSPWSVNLELGGNLEFAVGNVTYVYWAQDVLQYSTRGGNAAFFDDVWNASGSGTQMRAGTVAGDGTLVSSTAGEYYDCPANSSLPGNGYFIPLPAEIEVEMTAVLVAGDPGVSFAFNDGFGWLSFDTLSFPFASHAIDSGFVIDGSAYRPDGRFLDAEFALGAPAVGAQTHDNASHLQLELEYWNGHNLQEPTSAYNVASDSSESIGNVVAAGTTGPDNGTLLANLTAGGGGALGALWNRSLVGEVNLSSSVASGEVFLNGFPEGGFTGGAANVTLAPGNYTLAIYNQSLLEGETAVVVAAGSYQFVRIAWHDVFSIVFQADGLPAGAPWSVVVDNISLGGGSQSILCRLPNGAHSFRVAPLAGLTASPASGPLTVAGANVTLTITWTVQTFTLSFVPRGLPSDSPWSVTVNGMPSSPTVGPISYDEPAGTYAYAIAPVAGFRPNPSLGSVQLSDRNVTVNVSWSPFTFPVVFDAAGLPVGGAWSLAVESAGVWLNSTGTSPVVSLPLANGSFSYVVGAPTGYVTDTPTGHAVVNGSGVTIPLVFRGADGFLVGTIDPTSAQLWVDNASIPLTDGAFNVSLPPGTHDVRASAPGFVTVEMQVGVISDQVTALSWNLTAAPSSGGWTASLLYGAVAAAAVVVVAATVWFVRRPPKPLVVEAEVIDERPTGSLDR